MQKHKEKLSGGNRTLETNKPPFLGREPRGEARVESEAHTEEPRPRCPGARSAPRRCSHPPALASCLGPFLLGLVWFWFCWAGPGLGDEGRCDATKGAVARPARGSCRPQDAASSSHTSGSSGSLAASLLPCVLQETKTL